MKILCVANNYCSDRKSEPQQEKLISPAPTIFTKPDSAILKKNKPFFLPDFCKEVSLTVSPVLIITRLGKTISERFAARYYSEITIGIDIYSKDMLTTFSKAGLSWDLATGFDGSSPLGTFIPTAEVSDINNMDFRLEVNGAIVQQASTKELTFSFDKIVSYISRYFTLKTGDLVFATGGNSLQPFSIDCNRQSQTDIEVKAYLDNKLLLNFSIV